MAMILPVLYIFLMSEISLGIRKCETVKANRRKNCWCMKIRGFNTGSVLIIQY